nr:ribonuclease H-like domain-containing protein [Tanacetum cinerariifolium]
MMRSSPICLLSKASKNKSWLWHHRLNHLNFGTINDLAQKDLVHGLPRLKFEKDHLCSTCQLGKSKKYTHKPKIVNTIMEVLHTPHMDLCGPMRVQSINGKKYILVIVDDYSRFTWVKFLRTNEETLENGVVERRNRTLVEAARTMLIFLRLQRFYGQKPLLLVVTPKTDPLYILFTSKLHMSWFMRRSQIYPFCVCLVPYAIRQMTMKILANYRLKQTLDSSLVTFDELTGQTAPDHISSGPIPNLLTLGPISLGLVSSSAIAIPY